MPDSTSEILGLFSLLIGVVSYVPYLRTILSGKTKPHAFSWFVWALLMAIAFFAQDTGGAGPGAWATGLSAIVAFIIVAFALFKGEKQITRSDWITFIGALSAIPVWYATKDPLYAVILITVIDALGFYPTYRKSWNKPQEEPPLPWTLGAFKYVVALFALEKFNWTTALYPASLVLMNGVFAVMIVWRKRVLSSLTSAPEPL
ncbi:MAG: hypothetical protein V1721_10475 [Pseudomonadota bacterium]